MEVKVGIVQPDMVGVHACYVRSRYATCYLKNEFIYNIPTFHVTNTSC